MIDCKEKQGRAVQTTVKSTVEDSVNEQCKSCSDAVQETVMVCKLESESMSFGTLKQVIRSVAQEEDRRNNIIMSGVQEQEQENLVECVKEVFDEMRVRPDIRE